MTSYFAPRSITHDILGISMCITVGIPIVCIFVVPFFLIRLDLDPLESFILSCPPLVGLGNNVAIILLRFLLTTSLGFIVCRWYSFVLIKFVLILVHGNLLLKGLTEITRNTEKYPHLPQNPQRLLQLDIVSVARYRHLKQSWDNLLIDIFKSHKMLLLPCNFWSLNVGLILFFMISLGTTLISALNYAAFMLNAAMGLNLLIVCIFLSFSLSKVFLIIISFVTSIERNSRNLLKTLENSLMYNSYGKRCLRSQKSARIYTPFFSLRGGNKITFIRIPLDITLNMILTFSPDVW